MCHVLCLQNSAEHFVIYKQRKSLSLLLSFMKYYSERKRQRKGGEEGGRRRRRVGERQSYAAFPNCRIYLKFFFPTHVCTQSCPTLCDPMECSLPASSVWGNFQAKILEWVVIFSTTGLFHPRDRT